jgi:beta-glucanase (GH16 family)
MAASVFLVTLASAQTIPVWRLLWADEFSQADGSPPNSQKWGYDVGGGGWGNGELQYYTDRTNNSRIEGGCLVIEADAESWGGNNYTSARLLTKGKRLGSWAYGRMETRIKLPRGQGIWPAFWMLGTDFDTIGWPGCGEIDIMENVGKEPRTLHGTVHGPFSWGGHHASGGSFTNSVDLAEDFHPTLCCSS